MYGSALALASLPLLASARPGGLRPAKRTTPVKRLTWTQTENHAGSSFFDGWTFFTDADPTHGEVTFVNDPSLAYVDDNGVAIMKVDDTNDVAAGAPRNSVRITSNTAINENSMIIGDFAHTPFGCATWPAFWLVGPDWPSGGEVDIFEGVNLQDLNQMTLHTAPGCSHDAAGAESGTVLQESCDTSVNGNAGCGVQDPDTASYGDEFNNNGGGVWATLWDSDGISIWFWPRSSVPADATNGSPNPDGWGTPKAFWSFANGACASSFFNNLSAVFDITLCGDWAGAVFTNQCSGDCASYVASAGNFHDAYFAVNSVAFYSGA